MATASLCSLGRWSKLSLEKTDVAPKSRSSTGRCSACPDQAGRDIDLLVTARLVWGNGRHPSSGFVAKKLTAVTARVTRIKTELSAIYSGPVCIGTVPSDGLSSFDNRQMTGADCPSPGRCVAIGLLPRMKSVLRRAGASSGCASISDRCRDSVRI